MRNTTDRAIAEGEYVEGRSLTWVCHVYIYIASTLAHTLISSWAIRTYTKELRIAENGIQN